MLEQKLSQTDQILKHLDMYDTITTWEAISKYRITRLSAHIQFIEERGIPVYTRNVSSDGKHWVEYSLKSFELF